MSIEINRARVATDGTVSCEMVFPNITTFARSANEVLRINPDAFAPREATAPAYSHAEAMDRVQAETRRRIDAQRLPRAYVPPYDTTLGGQPLPDHVAALMDTQIEEPDSLTAGTAYGSEEHERKAGGTNSDEDE